MLKNAKSLNWASEMFYFTNKLNANVQKKTLAIAINIFEVVTSEVKKP